MDMDAGSINRRFTPSGRPAWPPSGGVDMVDAHRNGGVDTKIAVIQSHNFDDDPISDEGESNLTDETKAKKSRKTDDVDGKTFTTL